MKNVPKIVVDRLQKQALALEPHPDADLLTAFAERRLPQNERDPVTYHLSLCEDCREIVSLALPAPELTTSALLPAKSGFGWFTLPALRWGVVAAGVVLATLAGVQYQRHERQTAASVRMQPAQPSPTATAHPVEPLARPDVAPALDVAAPAPRPPRSHAPAAIHHGEAAPSLAANSPPMISPADNNREIVKAKDPVQDQSASSPAIASPAPPFQTSPTMMLRALPRWAITPEGTLQRSFDGGKNWETILPNSAASSAEGEGSTPAPAFLAVSASGLEVWAGGSSGALYHSIDGGKHWTRVALGDGASVLASDIISIEFADPQHGRVSATNAELWTTSDGGHTWQKQQ